MPGDVLDNPFAVPEPGRHAQGRRGRQATTLADLLHREMDRRGITAQKELGKEIGVGQATVSRLLNKGSVPREDTLRAVARFLRMPITDVRRAAGRSVGEPTQFTLPREFDQLPESDRDLLRRMGWQLLRARGLPVTRRT